jgi:glycosyltransferase involved in cell wall biosynthesis
MDRSLPPRVAVAVVGTMVPDEPAFHGPAFNRAGQMFQASLTRALIAAGLQVTDVFSVEPVPSFPKARRLIGRSGIFEIPGLRLQLIPFLNLQPFKALTAGVGVALAVVGWAWRHRRRDRIVHVFNMTMPPGVFVWAAARLTGSRVTVSALDVWKPGSLVPDTLAWRLDFLLQRSLLPRFDGQMVVSPAIAAELIPGRRVCVLEGGVDEARFSAASAPRLESRSGTFRLVLSGSLADFNGVELALAALSHLPSDIELVVAGAGPLANLVQERAATDPRVIFRGFLSFDEVLALYRTADLLLNVRITGTIDTRYFFPSKLMELLASGTPVLSTCTGQVESEYGHALYLLRDETPEALAARIVEIRRTAVEDRRALGSRARDFMLREKTWERQGQRLATYLRQEVLREDHQ